MSFLSRLEGTRQLVFYIRNLLLKNNSGALQVRNEADDAFAQAQVSGIKLMGNNASNGFVLTAPDSMGSNVTLAMPANAGANGQFLSTNGVDTLTWTNSTSEADVSVDADFDEGSGTLTIVAAPPDNSILKEVRIRVDSAAGGGSPTIQIGVSGDTDLYVLPDESVLTRTGLYIIEMYDELGSSPSPIIATITAAGQTFSGSILLTYSLE